MSVIQRSPKVSLTCPLGNVSSDKVVVNASINAHTTVTFTAFSGQEASTSSSRVFGKDAAALMGKAQTVGFSRRTKSDTTISLDDGGGNTMDFKGYLVSPTFFMDTRSINPAFAAVAESAILGSLRLDCYVTPVVTPDDQPLVNAWQSLEQMSIENNLADRLASLTRNMIDVWKSIYPAPDSVSTKLASEIDTINHAGPLKQWYKVLANSRKTMNPEWMGIVAESTESLSPGFNQGLLDLLRGASRDFQEIINTLCEEFQLMFVPGLGSAAGHFIQMKDVLGKASKNLVLPANSVLLNGNVNHDLLPVQQVLMRGIPTPATLQVIDAQDMQALGGGYLVGGFPTSIRSASGDIPIIPMPAFMASLVAVASTNGDGESPPTAATISRNFTRMNELAVRYANRLADKFVTDYCKAVYIDMAIGSTSTSISIPADLTLWPGERYSVQAADGSELFSGFLHGVQHTFSKNQGVGSAMTMCNFTHIMFPGFKLPGI